MFSAMFKSLFTNVKNKQNDESEFQIVNVTYKEEIESKLNELNEIKEKSDNGNNEYINKQDIIDTFEIMSIADSLADNDFKDNDSVSNFDDSKSEISSIGENTSSLKDEGPDKKKTINQINTLQCLFTWNIKSNNRKNIIGLIKHTYGEYNLDISKPEFTFQRFVGNLIIAYELFHKGKTDLGQMKILEIGKWLEELDNLNIDEFYLSINVGLKHVMTGTFVHMLFATNLTSECKWLLESIVNFANMDSKSRAAVHAVHAAILNEYVGNPTFFKKATEYAKKACDLDPNTSYWFYVYSLALTAQRHYLHTRKSKPTDGEINAIQQAILLSDGKNTHFNYHRMTLDRDTAIRFYHDNKHVKDKSVYQKNVQDNKTLVQMIKTIMSMEPKDPILLVNCAKTIMTLPIMVRDFNLGKQYLTKALKMAPNDKAVFESVGRTIELYQEISNKSNSILEKKMQCKNKMSTLGEELGILVKKHKKGENIIPQLTDLTTKHDGMDKCKLISQFCSYNIIFANNLKNGVEQFIWLIEQPGMVNNYIITQHFSSFGTKKFNLAEFICNEIRLATITSGTSSDDMLFYYKMLTKIMETFKITMKDVDSSMKTKLIVASDKAPSTTKSQQSEINSTNNENINKKSNTKSGNTDPKKCNNKSESKKKSTNKKTVNTPKNDQIKTPQKNANDLDEMKFKMAKFFTTAESMLDLSNNFNSVPQMSPDDIRNIQTQAEINNYTHQLYENILNRRQQQYSPQYLNNINSFLNQAQGNQHSFAQQPPSLLSLRPQINLENLKKQQTKKNPNKKI